jgi:hypothetical protein
MSCRLLWQITRRKTALPIWDQNRPPSSRESAPVLPECEIRCRTLFIESVHQRAKTLTKVCGSVASGYPVILLRKTDGNLRRGIEVRNKKTDAWQPAGAAGSEVRRRQAPLTHLLHAAICHNSDTRMTDKLQVPDSQRQPLRRQSSAN